MFGNNLSELFAKGGITLIVLIFCSILSISVAIEKFIIFKGITEKSIDDIKEKIKRMLCEKDNNKTIKFISTIKIKSFVFQVDSILSPIADLIIKNANLSKEELIEKSNIRLDRIIMNYEKRLGILSTLGSITPFIGLFGTVLGIIKSFEALSINETSGYMNVMSGIAEALIATAAGLIVAVPSVIFYNYFTRKLKMSLVIIEEAKNEIINIVKKSDA